MPNITPKVGLLFTDAELTTQKALIADTSGSVPTHKTMYDSFQTINEARKSIRGLGYNAEYSQSAECVITDMAVGYALSDNAEYGYAAKAWLLEFCGYTTWGYADGYDAHISEYAVGCAIAYDIVYSLCSAGERTTIETKLSTEIGKLYTVWSPASPVLDAPTPNIAACCVGGIGLVALVLNDATLLSWVSDVADWLLTQGGDDGDYREGTNYARAFRETVLYLSALRRIKTTDKYSGNSFLQHLPEWLLYNFNRNTMMVIEDTYDETEDDGTGYDREFGFCYRLADEYSDAQSQYFADISGIKMVANPSYVMPHTLNFLWKNSTVLSTSPNGVLANTKVFTKTGVVIYRSAFNPSASTDKVFRFKAGYNQSHAHNDPSSWSYFDGAVSTRAISGECGYFPAIKGGSSLSINFNTILSGGKGVEPYRVIAGEADSVLTTTSLQTAYAYMKGTSTNAGWVGGSYGDFTKFIRQVVLVKSPLYWVIFDDLTAPSVEQVDWVFTGNGGTFGVVDSQITLTRTVDLICNIHEPTSAHIIDAAASGTQWFAAKRIHPAVDTSTPQFLTSIFPTTALTTTAIHQGNCTGVIVDKDATHKDLILFSNDGNAVSEWIDLSAYYAADDGEAYTFSTTQILVSFSTYQVIRLVWTGSPPAESGVSSLISLNSRILPIIMGSS